MARDSLLYFPQPQPLPPGAASTREVGGVDAEALVYFGHNDISQDKRYLPWLISR